MNTHNAIITRNTPTAIIYLVDISGSMSVKCLFENEVTTKNDALNRIVNSSLQEIILRCKSYNKYNDYFDIAILGYNGNEVINLLERYTEKDGFCSINDIISCEIEKKAYNFIKITPENKKMIFQREVVKYIETEPSGTTPMHKGLNCCFKYIEKWIATHLGNGFFPPIVINISDGEASDATDKELLHIANKIKKLSTENGNVLLLNIHLSSSEYNEINDEQIFPNDIEKIPCVNKGKLLYEMSSYVPESFYEHLAQLFPDRDYNSFINSKMVAYNTSMSALTKVLEIGSISKSFIK